MKSDLKSNSKKKNLNLYFTVLIAVLFFSCAKENPNLVNPVLPSETVYIRFFNLATDNNSRKLVIGGSKETQEVTPGNMTLPVKPPPSDSVRMESKINGQTEYSSPKKIRMLRDTRYIVIGLSKLRSTNPLDTFLFLTTSYSQLRDANNAFLSVVNLNSDSTVKYNVVYGCPNGKLLFSSVAFMGISIQAEIYSGTTPISITRVKDSVSTLIGLFELNISPKGEYAIIIRKENDTESVYLLNQKDDTQNAIQKVEPTAERKSFVRVINLSNFNIDVTKSPNEQIFTNISPRTIMSYKDVNACESATVDSLLVSSSGSPASNSNIALNVGDRYSLVVIDSSIVAGKLSVIVPPIKLNQSLGNSCMIRVIHGSYLRGPLTLSMGSRDDTTSAYGFRSGDILAKELNYGNLSPAIFIPAGRAPLTLFSATQPAKLLYSSIGQFKPDGRYIVVIRTNEQAKDEISIIEDEDINTTPNVTTEGVFTQFAHFTPGVNKMEISIAGALKKAIVYYQGSLATVLPVGDNTVSFNGVSKSFTSDLQNRDLLISAGLNQTIEILPLKYEPLIYDNYTYKRRFINACKDNGLITVYTDPDKKFMIADGVAYGGVSTPETMYLQRKVSLFFFDTPTGTQLDRIDDISMVFGKNYSIIFGGSKNSTDAASKGYSLILLQEY